MSLFDLYRFSEKRVRLSIERFLTSKTEQDTKWLHTSKANIPASLLSVCVLRSLSYLNLSSEQFANRQMTQIHCLHALLRFPK